MPAYGPVMTRAQLQAERDMMQHLYERTTLLTTQGRSAQDMLEAGVMKEVNRQFQDPYRFLYDDCQGSVGPLHQFWGQHCLSGPSGQGVWPLPSVYSYSARPRWQRRKAARSRWST